MFKTFCLSGAAVGVLLFAACDDQEAMVVSTDTTNEAREDADAAPQSADEPRAERRDRRADRDGAQTADVDIPDVEIPFEKFTLDNGLTVVIHEDHKAPVAAVSVWYHVGSANEPEGKTGFAHLFEHIMFNGSENYNQDYFGPFEDVGATGMNGTTWFDRTNYFETVPTTALDMALWMESDRMINLLPVLDQAKLDEQRDVVKNEKRQGDNQPYGLVEYEQLEALFPAGHPYRHSTIGSMEDLTNASLEDAREWFNTYYGATNTVVVVAGDVDTEEVRQKVERYFGAAQPGDPLPRPSQNVPVRERDTYQVMADQVPQSRIYRTWVAPGRTTQTAAELDLAAMVLGQGKNSRLYKELVYDRQIANVVSASLGEFEQASMFEIQVTLKEGQDPEEAAEIIDGIVADFLENGPTAEELQRAKTVYNANTVRGLEQIGGFGGKAVTLAQSELYAGDPDFWRTRLEWQNAASAAEVQDAAQEWLGHGFHQITVNPFGQYQVAEDGADRSALPQVDTTPDLEWPEIQQAELSNGIPVIFARRDSVPQVDIAVRFDAGYASDTVMGEDMTGLSSFTMSMLDEGAGDMGALDVAASLESLGAEFSAGSNLDASTVEFSALTDNLEETVNLAGEIIKNPSFPSQELERVRGITLAGIEQEKAQPIGMALRLLPPELYGEDHPYGVPFTGSGTAEAVTGFDQEDLQAYHDAWLRSDNATIFVVGDTTLEDIQPILEAEFGDWAAPDAPMPEKDIPDASNPAESRVIIIDRPGSPQSMILGGQLAPPETVENNLAITAMNSALGGEFSARVNMNLREDKGWAYGAYTFLQSALHQRPFMVYAPVQSDRTADSIQELQNELTGVVGNEPITAEELARVVKNNTRALPGLYETGGAVLSSLMSSYELDRPLDYPVTLKPAYDALTVQDLGEAAEDVVNPDELIWMVIGDRSQIEQPIRELGIGPVEVRSIDGEVLAEADDTAALPTDDEAESDADEAVTSLEDAGDETGTEEPLAEDAEVEDAPEALEDMPEVDAAETEADDAADPAEEEEAEPSNNE